MVGRLVSFWDGFLAGATLVLGRIHVFSVAITFECPHQFLDSPRFTLRPSTRSATTCGATGSFRLCLCCLVTWCLCGDMGQSLLWGQQKGGGAGGYPPFDVLPGLPYFMCGSSGDKGLMTYDLCKDLIENPMQRSQGWWMFKLIFWRNDPHLCTLSTNALLGF